MSIRDEIAELLGMEPMQPPAPQIKGRLTKSCPRDNTAEDSFFLDLVVFGPMLLLWITIVVVLCLRMWRNS